MHRLLIAAGIALFVMSPAEAASRHKHKGRAPAAQSALAPAVQRAFTNRPTWAAPQQCYTNDGYGRYLPCDVGDGR